MGGVSRRLVRVVQEDGDILPGQRSRSGAGKVLFGGYYRHGKERRLRRAGEEAGGVDGGIPWFAVVDADGKVLANSEGPKGNIGYPDTMSK